jgi:hypothetical protein
MVTTWIRLALAVLGAVLVHSAAFLLGAGEPLAIVLGLAAGPAISWAILAWAPVGGAAALVDPLDAVPPSGAPERRA